MSLVSQIFTIFPQLSRHMLLAGAAACERVLINHSRAHILDKRQLLCPLVRLFPVCFKACSFGSRLFVKANNSWEHTSKCGFMSDTAARKIAPPDSARHEPAARLMSWFDSRAPGGLIRLLLTNTCVCHVGFLFNLHRQQESSDSRRPKS